MEKEQVDQVAAVAGEKQNKTLWHLNAGIQQIAIAWAFIHLLGNLCCNVHRALLDRLERVFPKTDLRLGMCWMFRVPFPELRSFT